jgi:pyridoxine kinase
LRGDSLAQALSRAVSSLYGVLRRSAEADAKELLLIAAQDQLVTPLHSFHAERP